MSSFIEVKELFSEIGTKKRSVNTGRYFLGMIVSGIVLYIILCMLKFLIATGAHFDWIFFLVTVPGVLLVLIAIIFYAYGLFQYGMHRNK